MCFTQRRGEDRQVWNVCTWCMGIETAQPNISGEVGFFGWFLCWIVCVCVCVCVCLCVRAHYRGWFALTPKVGVFGFVCVCVCVCVCVSLSLLRQACRRVGIYACVHVCVFAEAGRQASGYMSESVCVSVLRRARCSLG